MTFPILAALLVRLVVLLPFQLLRLSLATPSRWTPLALSVVAHCVVFFFSSRRRHTIWTGDWSSDVCSSDLPDVGLEHQADPRGRRGDDVDGLLDHGHHLVPLPLDVGEHRVGLAGQSGGADEIGRASCRERVMSWVGG